MTRKSSQMPVELAELRPGSACSQEVGGPFYFGYEPAAIDLLEKQQKLPRSFALSEGGRARAWTGAQILEHRAELSRRAELNAAMKKISRQSHSRRRWRKQMCTRSRRYGSKGQAHVRSGNIKRLRYEHDHIDDATGFQAKARKLFQRLTNASMPSIWMLCGFPNNAKWKNDMAETPCANSGRWRAFAFIDIETGEVLKTAEWKNRQSQDQARQHLRRAQRPGPYQPLRGVRQR